MKKISGLWPWEHLVATRKNCSAVLKRMALTKTISKGCQWYMRLEWGKLLSIRFSELTLFGHRKYLYWEGGFKNRNFQGKDGVHRKLFFQMNAAHDQSKARSNTYLHCLKKTYTLIHTIYRKRERTPVYWVEVNIISFVSLFALSLLVLQSKSYLCNWAALHFVQNIQNFHGEQEGTMLQKTGSMSHGYQAVTGWKQVLLMLSNLTALPVNAQSHHILWNIVTSEDQSLPFPLDSYCPVSLISTDNSETVISKCQSHQHTGNDQTPS